VTDADRLADLERTFANLRKAMLKGVMSRGTDRGYHVLSVAFESLDEMTDAWKALYHAIRERK
jgi:electron transfer flavoprotein alpha/beta subunit